MANRLKVIISIIGFSVLFLLIAPYLLRGMLAITRKPYTFIDYADAEQGCITGVEIERQFTCIIWTTIPSGGTALMRLCRP